MILSFLISLVIGLSCYKKSSKIKYLCFFLVLLVVSIITWLFISYPDQASDYKIGYPLSWLRWPEMNIRDSEYLSLHFLDYMIGGESVPKGAPAISATTIFTCFWFNLPIGIVGFIIGTIISSRFQHRLRKHI